MTTQTADRTPSPTSSWKRSPWLEELLEVLELRRSVLIAVTAGVVALGLVIALAAPGILPQRALVGAAVGLGAVLLGVAAAVAVDAWDLVVRGPRHVRSAGGRLAAVLPGPVSADTAERLAEGFGSGSTRAPARYAVAPAAKGVGLTSEWADAIGVALARRDVRVLVIDVTEGADQLHKGVVDIVERGTRLATTVRFDSDLLLARMGPGGDTERAVAAVPEVLTRLPSDIDVAIVALPPLSEPGVLTAAAATDRVVMLAHNARTSRVELIASLDALDGVGAAADVALLMPERPEPGSSAEPDHDPVDEPDHDPDDDPDDEPDDDPDDDPHDEPDDDPDDEPDDDPNDDAANAGDVADGTVEDGALSAGSDDTATLDTVGGSPFAPGPGHDAGTGDGATEFDPDLTAAPVEDPAGADDFDADDWRSIDTGDVATQTPTPDDDGSSPLPASAAPDGGDPIGADDTGPMPLVAPGGAIGAVGAIAAGGAAAAAASAAHLPDSDPPDTSDDDFAPPSWDEPVAGASAPTDEPVPTDAPEPTDPPAAVAETPDGEPIAPDPVAPDPVASEPVAPDPVAPDPVAPDPVAPETTPDPVPDPTESVIADPLAGPADDEIVDAWDMPRAPDEPAVGESTAPAPSPFGDDADVIEVPEHGSSDSEASDTDTDPVISWSEDEATDASQGRADGEDPLRVAAALQTLAQEVWGREQR